MEDDELKIVKQLKKGKITEPSNTQGSYAFSFNFW